MLKTVLILSLASLLILSGCEQIPDVSRLPAKPVNVMTPPPAENQLTAMAEATDGAQGLKEDWLLGQAAISETLRQQVIVLQKFINDTWRSRGYD